MALIKNNRKRHFSKDFKERPEHQRALVEGAVVLQGLVDTPMEVEPQSSFLE